MIFNLIAKIVFKLKRVKNDENILKNLTFSKSLITLAILQSVPF